jgi:hypothetical protein
VFITYRSREDAAENAAKAIADKGGIPHVIKADFSSLDGSDRAEIGRMLDAIVVSGSRRGDLGRLDCGALR